MTDLDDNGITLQDEEMAAKNLAGRSLSELSQSTVTVSLFGGFGLGNFGNEATLQAILHYMRRLLPNARVSCICTFPTVTAATHNVATLPISRAIVTAWRPRNRVVRTLRSIFIGIPSELYRWIEGLFILKRTDLLIVPGTGLLTDAYGLGGWGPYGLFKWSLLAKLRGCKLIFVSVGAGPIYSRAGKWMVKSALALANFRSYRDAETKEYLSSIGVPVASDRVCPDLAFSLAPQMQPQPETPRPRRVVGLGLMLYHRKLSGDLERESTYAAYLDKLAAFAKWLLAQNYNIRLLIGELSDNSVVAEFKELLKRLQLYDENRIVDEPVTSVENLLAQLGGTDVVVATRFHNVLLALLLNKPVISLSFHQKCTSLMESIGLQDFCQNIQSLNTDRLVEQFCQLERNADNLKASISDKVDEHREALDEQYRLIFRDLLRTWGLA